MHAKDEEISDAMLDNIPEIDASRAGGFSGFANAEPPLAFTVVAETADERAPGPAAPFMPASPLAMHMPLATQGPVTTKAPAPAAAVPTGNVSDLVANARAQMAAVFESELTRVESSFGTLLQQMEQKLKQADLELAAVRAEHEKVKAENDKKAAALRELKKALEGI